MTSTGPEQLWQPPAELVEASRLTEYMRWLEAERGLSFDSYEELWRWSVDDLEGFWAVDLGLLRGAGRRRARRRPRLPRDARRRVVPRHQPQLRRARLRRQGRRRDRDPARLRAARARRAELGRAAQPGRRRRRRPARARGRARRPRRRLHAEHPRGDRRLPRHRLDRRGLVELLARLRPGQRHRPLRPDRAQGPLRGRRLPLRRQATSTAARSLAELQERDAEPRAHRRPPLPRARPRPRARCATRSAGTSWRPPARAPSSPSSASPSTTRSGSSTPRAPPACRRRSSRARAASCSST